MTRNIKVVYSNANFLVIEFFFCNLIFAGAKKTFLSTKTYHLASVKLEKKQFETLVTAGSVRN